MDTEDKKSPRKEGIGKTKVFEENTRYVPGESRLGDNGVLDIPEVKIRLTYDFPDSDSKRKSVWGTTPYSPRLSF